MAMTAFMFAVSVLTYYAFYQYIVQRNGVFSEFPWDSALFQVYHLALILNVIYNADRMTSEVNKFF